MSKWEGKPEWEIKREMEFRIRKYFLNRNLTRTWCSNCKDWLIHSHVCKTPKLDSSFTEPALRKMRA